MGAPPRDPRVTPVEENLREFLAVLPDISLFSVESHPDVTTYRSGLPHPLFNGVVGEAFAPGTEERRTAEVIAPFVSRGLPFLWWSSPSGWTPGTDRALTAAGAIRDDATGMHAELTAPPPPGRPVEGLGITRDTGETAARVMTAGFDMPAELAAPVHQLLDGFDPDRLVNLVATLDGVPVAAGSLWTTGTTAGLYNIATLEPARGRGVGYAVTAALLEEGRRRGCTEAILHASEMGRPVYERLGFVEVCRMPQYVWLPSA